MNNCECFVRIDDVGRVLLEYIKSEDFEKAVDSTQGKDSGAFMSAVGMAGCVIMARCQRYYGVLQEPQKEEAT